MSVFMRAFKKSVTFFGKHFWGGDGGMFFVPFAKFHVEIIRLIRSTKKYIALVVPRGFGKSKLVSVLFVVWSIVFAKEPYIMIVSASQKKARQIMRDITGLIQSPAFKRVFGDLREESPLWNQDRKVLVNKRRGIYSVLEVQGADQQILGASEGDARITLAILDDIMAEEDAKNIELSEALAVWFQRSLKPAMAKKDRRGRKGRIIVIGTPFEPQDFMHKVMSKDWRHMFRVIRFPALDENDQSIWPQMWSTEELHAEREAYTRIGALHVFNTQYMVADPEGEEGVRFPMEKVVRIKPKDTAKIIKKCEGVYIHVDMAYTQQTYSDYVGITVTAVGKGGEMTCLEAYRGKIDASTLFDVLWNFQTKYGLVNFKGIYAETKQYNLMQSFFRERSIREGKNISIHPMIWIGEKGEESKTNRINTLIPHAHIGNIRLVEGTTHILELEMASYDGRKKKGLDTLDSFANNIKFIRNTPLEIAREQRKGVSAEKLSPEDHFKKFVESRSSRRRNSAFRKFYV